MYVVILTKFQKARGGTTAKYFSHTPLPHLSSDSSVFSAFLGMGPWGYCRGLIPSVRRLPHYLI